jgi:hypothetical protein
MAALCLAASVDAVCCKAAAYRGCFGCLALPWLRFSAVRPSSAASLEAASLEAASLEVAVFQVVSFSFRLPCLRLLCFRPSLCQYTGAPQWIFALFLDRG